jgi:hypothetical protein
VTPLETRIKEQMPSVLLTLASIVQALALEVLWDSTMEHPHLFAGGVAAWVGWLQVVALFLVVALVWLYYVQLVMRFRWVPTPRDSLVPFAFGVGQFVLAELLDPQWLAIWFFGLAALIGAAFWTSIATLSRAAADPDNAWFFAEFRPGRLERYGPLFATATPLFAFGVLAELSGGAVAIAIPCLVATDALLLLQIVLQRHYWRRSLAAGSTA